MCRNNHVGGYEGDAMVAVRVSILEKVLDAVHGLHSWGRLCTGDGRYGFVEGIVNDAAMVTECASYLLNIMCTARRCGRVIVERSVLDFAAVVNLRVRGRRGFADHLFVLTEFGNSIGDNSGR